MRHYFIYNPAAGNGVKGKEFLENFEELKKNSDYDLYLYTTKACGDATRIASQIAIENKNQDIAIYACGGDGTTNEVLNGITEYSNVILGIIPIGSCNDFLKLFPQYDFLNLDKQINGTAKAIDVLKVDNNYCLNVANIGFDAKVNYDQVRFRYKFKTVKSAYNYAIFRNIIKPLGDKVIIKADNKEIYNGKILLMAMGNGGFYGGGYKCAPYAKVDDGLVDSIIIKKVSIFTFLRLVKLYKNGQINGNPKYAKYVKCVNAKKIEIISDDMLTVCLDGETIHKKHVNIEVLKHQIRFNYPRMK